MGESVGKDGRKIIKVTKENFLDLMKDLRNHGFDHLSLVTGVDRKDFMEVVYHLHSMNTNEYVVVKVETRDYKIPSVTGIWKSADWDEREQYDMLGIIFEGHPNLKRLFLPESWVGHPLRKNYDMKKTQYINMDEEGNDYATFDERGGW